LTQGIPLEVVMFARLLSVAFLLACTSPVFAAGEAISVNTSFNLQMPATGSADTAVTDQERSLKRSLYERAARECDDLKASIAMTCQITGISVSTQISRNPGAPPQIYVSSNVQMQITVK
jgi:hypothetical protein